MAGATQCSTSEQHSKPDYSAKRSKFEKQGPSCIQSRRDCSESTEVGCLTSTTKIGGENMELEVVEGKCAEEPVIEAMGCSEGGFMIGCCIIHFWCWERGHGLCC